MNPLIINEINLIESEGYFFVSSLEIADKFNKNHKDVLRSVENLECSEQFNRRNFAPITYTDSRGRRQKKILVTKDGFCFLAMGFTGAEAARWKELFIVAFNKLEKMLLTDKGALWALKRYENKMVRKPLTDAIKEFVAYAIEQGSESYRNNPGIAYANFTKMEYKALFLVSKNVAGIRDKLSMFDLSTLSIAERGVRKVLQDEMAKGTHYKDIYQIAKEKVESLAELVGPSDQLSLVDNPFAPGGLLASDDDA